MRLRRRSKPDQPAERPASAAAAGPGPKARPAGDPHERIEGLRAWVAQVDRKLGVRSYAGGAAIVLALAAGIVGVVLALSAKDESATKDEVRALRGELESVAERASETAEEGVAALTERLDTLEGRVSQIQSSQRTTERELSVVEDDIDDLRTQISDLRTSPAAAGPAGGESP